MAAYADVLERCSTDAAPWHVVPADRKWYRNWAITQLLCEQLEELGLRWPEPAFDVAEELRRRAGDSLESASVDLDAVEVRVLGCLIEKQRTTPDVYPLSLNSLRAACNQSTNRDPVVAYDEATIRDALHRLARRRWTRFASGARAAKYRHLLDENPGLSVDQQALLAVLMLRGPQTPGELRQRVDRLYAFPDGELDATLAGLIERGFVARHARRPGQKEERYAHRLSEDLEDEPAAAPAPAAGASPPTAPPPESRLDRLEREVDELKRQVAELHARKGANRGLLHRPLRADLAAPGAHLHVAVQQRARPRVRLVLVPLLGFFLLPWTTLAYAFTWDSGRAVEGFDWFIVGLRVRDRPRVLRQRPRAQGARLIERRADVLIVGGGLGGVAAAIAAAGRGLDVV